MNAQIIAITNQKGSVGKTTTCANLGIGLEKVLLTDQPIAPGEGILHHPEGIDLSRTFSCFLILA